ncbi:hypothetical protein [Massilia endophytica]|uniref:hypothetical protein n=1 Tax=Massilia endophytica TaxID=2899220 RepID=UPI001E5B42F0|nr:hypothetical protein [Massilia endophytica]UGQ44714.1 hypothetical protein LSQ66_12960 [Massilia endophytica]
MGKSIGNGQWAKGAAACARAGAAAFALGCALLAASPAAFADPQSGQGVRRDEGQQAGQPQRNPRSFRDSRWGDERDTRAFEARAEEQRRIMQENANNAEMNRRMSRMTADERRDLRRQINEAGAEVYSITPRR